MRYLLATLICGLGTSCLGGERMVELPTPHYRKKASDPSWLVYASQFHGHLGPWAVAGARAGMTGRTAVGAEGYFDLKVVCEGPFAKPPRSCFLDGLQVSTGATMGKRNLDWVKKGEVLVRVKNTQTGQQVEIRPTAALLELLHSFCPQPKARAHADDSRSRDHDDAHTQLLESIARKIAAMPAKKLFRVQLIECE